MYLRQLWLLIHLMKLLVLIFTFTLAQKGEQFLRSPTIYRTERRFFFFKRRIYFYGTDKTLNYSCHQYALLLFLFHCKYQKDPLNWCRYYSIVFKLRRCLLHYCCFKRITLFFMYDSIDIPFERSLELDICSMQSVSFIYSTLNRFSSVFPRRRKMILLQTKVNWKHNVAHRCLLRICFQRYTEWHQMYTNDALFLTCLSEFADDVL